MQAVNWPLENVNEIKQCGDKKQKPEAQAHDSDRLKAGIRRAEGMQESAGKASGRDGRVLNHGDRKIRIL